MLFMYIMHGHFELIYCDIEVEMECLNRTS